MACAGPLLAACVLGAALILNGCGGGGTPTPGPGPSSTKQTVIVMRHCARSTPDTGVITNPKFADYNDYAQKAWPPFSVKAMYCLPRGEAIVEAQGKFIKSSGGVPLPIRAVADDVANGQRDNVTMQAFLKGLAYEAGSVSASVDHSPFASGVDTPACKAKRTSPEAIVKAMQAGLDSHPLDAAMLQKLYASLGDGVAGNWTGIPCQAKAFADKNVVPVGACFAAGRFAERLLMEQAGGLAVGWGHVTASDIPKLLVLNSWWMFRWLAIPEMYKVVSASLAGHIGATLGKAKPEPGTNLYVGHDSDLMGLSGVLGLTWDASPYPITASTPGSMLRFDRDGDEVTASYLYVANFGDSDGSMLTVPANFGGSSNPSNKMTVGQFTTLLAQNTFPECADMPPKVEPVLAV